MAANERLTIQSIIAANVTLLYPGMPIAWEGVPFTKPDASVTYIVPVVINSGRARQVTLGMNNRTIRSTALIQVNIYTPLGSGASAGEVMGDAISGWLVKSTLSLDGKSVLVFEPGYSKFIGSRDGRAMTALTIPYHCDTFESIVNSGGNTVQMQRVSFTGHLDGMTNAFTLSAMTNPSNLLVLYNGSIQDSSVISSVISQVVTLSFTPAPDDQLEFLFF